MKESKIQTRHLEPNDLIKNTKLYYYNNNIFSNSLVLTCNKLSMENAAFIPNCALQSGRKFCSFLHQMGTEGKYEKEICSKFCNRMYSTLLRGIRSDDLA